MCVSPSTWPRAPGEGLHEISVVEYIKPQGWKLSRGEVITVVLYLALVSSGDLRAQGKSGF